MRRRPWSVIHGSRWSTVAGVRERSRRPARRWQRWWPFRPAHGQSFAIMPSTMAAVPYSTPDWIDSIVVRPTTDRGGTSSTRRSPAARPNSAFEADLDAGDDRAAQIGAVGRDHVEGGGGAEVDHHGRAAVAVERADGVGHPVGTHLGRVVVADRQAGLHARSDHHRLDAKAVLAHLAQLGGHKGHAGTDGDAMQFDRRRPGRSSADSSSWRSTIASSSLVRSASVEMRQWSTRSLSSAPLLGKPETDGHGLPVRCDSWVFRSMVNHGDAPVRAVRTCAAIVSRIGLCSLVCLTRAASLGLLLGLLQFPAHVGHHARCRHRERALAVGRIEDGARQNHVDL
jgi:hypothetical protein